MVCSESLPLYGYTNVTCERFATCMGGTYFTISATRLTSWQPTSHFWTLISADNLWSAVRTVMKQHNNLLVTTSSDSLSQMLCPIWLFWQIYITCCRTHRERTVYAVENTFFNNSSTTTILTENSLLVIIPWDWLSGFGAQIYSLQRESP